MSPKGFDDDVRARAIKLFLQLRNATKAAEQIMAEYPGVTVAGHTIRRWGSGLNIKLVAGRKKGAPATRFSPHKADIIACHAEGLTQAETCVRLGLSRALVSKHWPRTPA